MVKAQALGKARCAVGIPEGGIVLGADTIVVLDNEVLGKPQDEADARANARTFCRVDLIL